MPVRFLFRTSIFNFLISIFQKNGRMKPETKMEERKMASPYGSAIFLCVPTGIIPPLAGWLVRRRVVHHRSHMLAPVPANTHHHISPNPSRHRREGSHRLKNKRSKVWRMPYFRPCVPTGIVRAFARSNLGKVTHHHPAIGAGRCRFVTHYISPSAPWAWMAIGCRTGPADGGTVLTQRKNKKRKRPTFR